MSDADPDREDESGDASDGPDEDDPLSNQPSMLANAPRCGANTRSGEPCRRAAMSGRNRCPLHGGKTPSKAENPAVGAPDNNINGAKHGLYMKADKYIERMDDEADREWIRDMIGSLEDIYRKRWREAPPKAKREILVGIAIDLHRISWSNGWFADTGLTQVQQEIVNGETITAERVNVWSGEIRKYSESVTRRMDKLGLLDDPEEYEQSGKHVLHGEHVTVTVDNGSSPSGSAGGVDELKPGSADGDADGSVTGLEE